MKNKFQKEAVKILNNYFSTLSFYSDLKHMGGITQEEHDKAVKKLRGEVILTLFNLGYDYDEAIAFTQVEGKEAIL